ncbi:MAG: TRAP transporter TatT component family protein [Vicinamibacterales bacterium]|nr:TRAP transporter TatT component family protein [Vicinamibacterales bacterium]
MMPIALRPLALVVVVALAGSGCSIKRVALKGVADTLAASGDTFSSDEDPELVRDAVPFSLKMMESVLAELPAHGPLLLSTCSGFAQYSYAFVHGDADLIEAADFDRAQELRARARKMYLRARGYCLRHLELRYPGIGARLVTDPKGAVAAARREDVAALYWTGASWGLAVSLGLDKPELIADLPSVRALFDRALALDAGWNRGAIHAALISLDASAVMGGTPERARAHFAKALELSGGADAGLYVSLATAVAQPLQDRAEFERLLNQALAVDVDRHPAQRLANVLAQRQARHLLSRIDDLFVPDEPPPDEPPPPDALRPPFTDTGVPR